MNDDDTKLSPLPDLEAGRLFNEWWFSVPREEMEKLGENGTIQQEFDMWRAKRSTNH
jgi:hypothetical protein